MRGYVFGVEFVELGLGDEAEQREAAGRRNERGLHGNAIVTPASLGDPAVVRLPDAGAGWFAADSPQPRVGGRMAVVATVAIDGVPVQVASTHLENRDRPPGTGPSRWRRCCRRSTTASAGGPAIVGGDFNTLGADYRRAARPSRLVRALRRERAGALHVAGASTSRSSRWRGRTVSSGPTPTSPRRRRTRRSAGLPDHVPIRLDWLLVRGLVARRPAVIPAGGLSDHHLVSVGVRLP